jgi:carbonic anhydrase
MSERLSRRRFLTVSGFGVAAVIAPDAAGAIPPEPAFGSAVSPKEAMRLLVAGNRRWVTGKLRHPHQSVARRMALEHEQHPFATVFSCIDSRVPPEIVFDRGIGDLAVVRTGAQVLDEGVVFGSVEFAVDHLHTPLILVMGHQRCGAVEAAIDSIQSGKPAPGHIQAVVNALRPAYRVARKQPGDLVENMVRAQTKLTVKRIRNDPLIEELVRRGKLVVRGAYYSLDTGAVTFIA